MKWWNVLRSTSSCLGRVINIEQIIVVQVIVFIYIYRPRKVTGRFHEKKPMAELLLPNLNVILFCIVLHWFTSFLK